MDKETMIYILNQHGIDVLYDVISDNTHEIYEKGYDCGYSQGWDACYNVYVED